MTTLTYESFPGQFRALPGFDRVYDEHIAANDELLPHVLFGDLVRFLSSEVELHGPESPTLKQAMRLLEQGMANGDTRVQELVAVSFLENLERDDASFSAIRALFGPALAAQYEYYDEAYRQ